MTIGNFWAGITVLAAVYNGKVIEGPMSPNWAKRSALTYTEKWSIGLACRMQLENPVDFSALKEAAAELKIYAHRVNDPDVLVTLEPLT